MSNKYLNSMIFINKKKLKVIKEENNEIYLSKVIKFDDFKKIIVSWNAVTPLNSYIVVQARVFVQNKKDKKKKWSEWMSWGKWGTNIKRGSESSKCDEVRIDVDTLSINEGYSGKAIQLKIISYYDNKGFSADIREVAITYYKENNNDLKNKKYELINKLIETPCISQMKRDEKIAHKICSPTSLTMLLNRLGENLKVEDVAYSCFDYNYNEFGNWTYNVAYAGSLGYKAYVEYGGIDSLIREISNGNPIEVSVKYTNDINNKEYPYIENAPLTTSGHLIVVCGIEVSNNGKWVIVNDPAGKDDESVRLKYKFEDFMKAWQRSNYIMYVIYKQD